MKIRVIKTASKAWAVQVVRYQNNKRIVLQHIGSAHTEEALNDLMILAEEWIKDYTRQFSIFPDENPPVLCATSSLQKCSIENQDYMNYFLQFWVTHLNFASCLYEKKGIRAGV